MQKILNNSKIIVAIFMFFVIVNISLFVLEPVKFLIDMQPIVVSKIHNNVTKGYTHWRTPIELNGIVYPRSISTHPTSEEGYVQYKINKKYKRFIAKIGIMQTENGKVKFSVGINGGEILYRKVLTGVMNPEDINVFLRNAETIELYVDPMEDNICDHAVWVNARFAEKNISWKQIAYIIFTMGIYILFICCVPIRFERIVWSKIILVIITVTLICYMIYEQLCTLL